MNELSEMALIMMFTTFGSLIIMFGTWFLRQHYKHKYLLKRARLSKRSIIPKTDVKEPTTTENLSKILPALAELAPYADDLGDLAERTGLIDKAEGGDLGEIGELLKNPAIQGLIQGITSKKQQGGDNYPWEGS